jgi:hypothetical protein
MFFNCYGPRIVRGHVHFVRNLIVDFRRNTDAARLGDALQTRGASVSAVPPIPDITARVCAMQQAQVQH